MWREALPVATREVKGREVGRAFPGVVEAGDNIAFQEVENGGDWVKDKEEHNMRYVTGETAESPSSKPGPWAPRWYQEISESRQDSGSSPSLWTPS